MVAHLDGMVGRYRTGEPLQYVLGRWGFRRLDLAVDRRVLIPRPETELVAEVAIGLAASVAAPRVVADLGTGSGAIGLSLATELPLAGTTVWITDVSDDALAVARANLAGIGRAGAQRAGGRRLVVRGVARRRGVRRDRQQPALRRRRRRPSSTPACATWEPAAALFAGPDGLDAIRVLVAGAHRPARVGRLARARARRRPGRCRCAGCSPLPATATSRPAAISPATTASRSPSPGLNPALTVSTSCPRRQLRRRRGRRRARSRSRRAARARRS